MQVVILIQTYKNPGQIYRLVEILKASGKDCFILVSHDASNFTLESEPISHLSDVKIINSKVKPRRGRFSLIESYLESISWLIEEKIDFKWLCNITGQDYPIKPLCEIEQYLLNTNYDGFLESFQALSTESDNPWGYIEGSIRYRYHHYWITNVTAPWQRIMLKPLKSIVNSTQPLLRLQTTYGISAGVLAASSPFEHRFVCYGGSDFKTLSKKCIQFIFDTYRDNKEIVNYYRKTCMPEESFAQTILLNDSQFNLLNDNKRFIKWQIQDQGHPGILTKSDLEDLLSSDCHFARKFDIQRDHEILDLLDKSIL